MHAKAWIQFVIWQVILVGLGAAAWLIVSIGPGRFLVTTGVSLSAAWIAATLVNLMDLVSNLRKADDERERRAEIGKGIWTEWRRAMADRVTLYRVRRPDGTVIPASPKGHRYAAVVSASYSEPQLSNLLLAADDDQKFDDYLKITGYTVEAVEYAPVNHEREAAIKMMREALSMRLTMIENCSGSCGASGKDIGPRDALAFFDRADGAK